MGAHSFKELISHYGHKIEVVCYGDSAEDAVNVAIECETCNEVLLDYHKVSPFAAAFSKPTEPDQ